MLEIEPAWVNVVMSAISALCGGFIGGWLVAHKIGRWQQLVEDRLTAAEEWRQQSADALEVVPVLNTRIAAAEDRLKRGDAPVGEVPILRTRLDVVIEELRCIRAEMREDRSLLVPRTECERRHEHADA